MFLLLEMSNETLGQLLDSMYSERKSFPQAYYLHVGGCGRGQGFLAVPSTGAIDFSVPRNQQSFPVSLLTNETV